MSKPLTFHPEVLARARRECNMYLMTRTGQVGNTVMFTVARLKRGQPDPARTYEMWADLEMRDDTGPTFVPTRCSCEDSLCRGRRCKHQAAYCLWMEIPVEAGRVIGEVDDEQISKSRAKARMAQDGNYRAVGQR